MQIADAGSSENPTQYINFFLGFVSISTERGME
jgi:hypothetical protein